MTRWGTHWTTAALVCAFASCALAERLLLQVEDFDGPWRRQTNIKGYAGKGFCTSNANPKIAETVMKTTARVENAGRYYVWMRAYTSPNYKRALRVAINGKPLNVTHKGNALGWSWQLAGQVELTAGPVAVAVLDADVGYETADAVLLTDDKDDDPTADERNWTIYPDGLPDRANALRFNIDACLELCRKHEVPKSKAEWEATRGDLTLKLRKAMGLLPWPEKTPLDARVTGRAERDGYSIENVVFESRPNFYVTANVYVPKGAKRPLPAVIIAMGHAMKEGKNYGLYQSVQVGLVRRGFLVLGYDPINQGERRGRGFAHQVSYSSMMAGMTAEGVMAWDTIRAVDYLLTRPEVDPKRIGLAGNSGGGLNTLYTAPIEPRIAVAASFGCTCEYYAFIKDGGNHCICNHQIGIVRMMEEFQVVGLCVPRPYLAGTGVKDPIFPIAGVRRTMANVKSIYSLYGVAERTTLAESPDGHGWYPPLRGAAYGWFDKWLMGKGDGSPQPEAEFKPEAWNAKDLMCFKDGKMPGDAANYVTIARDRAAKCIAAYPAAPTDPASHKAWATGLRAKLWDVLGGRPTTFTPVTKSLGEFKWSGTEVERLTIRTEPKMEVSAFFIKPKRPAGPMPAVVWLHDDGKIAARNSELVATLLGRGIAVLAVDPRGLGEAAVTYNHCVSNSVVLGRPLLAQQVWDVLAVTRAIADRADVDAKRIMICGEGRVGVIATVAGALSDEFAGIVASGSPGSFALTIEDPVAQPYWIFAPNILTLADVPQLTGMQAPRPFLTMNPTGFNNRPMPAAAAGKTLAAAKALYQAAAAKQAISVLTDEKPTTRIAAFIEACLSAR